VTVAEMRRADAAALAMVDESVLVARAGTAVAHRAIRLLGGAYGRRVVVVAGKGNNGADGLVAAAHLARRGARVVVLDAADPGTLPEADLVIDAAYGTGFSGAYEAPGPPRGAVVLAVDIPSGLSGDTGAVSGRALVATETVTFAARKPGLLQGEGPAHSGRVTVADIGIDVGEVDAALVDDDDVAALLPPRARDSHKWANALAVVAGSAGMEGSAALSAAGASHAGAGMVRLAVPGSGGDGVAGPWPLEAVRVSIGTQGWASAVLSVLERCKALVVGPGLGRSDATVGAIRELIARSPVPVVADADALFALGDAASAKELIARAGRPVILTPHDGEYARLAGHAPGPDRLAAARDLAAATGAVVLVKGSLTALAAPGTGPSAGIGGPRVLLAAAGSARLATAGTGDVLSGVIGAFLARGLAPLIAGALGAHVHGRAAGLGHREGLVAGDLPGLVAEWLSGAQAASSAGPDHG